MLSAYLLVSHGSHDPRPEIAMSHLAFSVQSRFQKIESQQDKISYSKYAGGVAAPPQCETKYETVGTAYLELQPQPLHLQIVEFAQNILSRSTEQSLHLKILPLFLLAGVHVMEDIPTEVEAAQRILGDNVVIDLQPYIGCHGGLVDLVRLQKNSIRAQKYILLAHGSRRPGFEHHTETLAANLGLTTAYWAVQPKLESRVKEFASSGYREIAVIPYFLFAGGITDAIETTIEKLELQFPGVSLKLAQPLGVNEEFADLIWDYLHK
ncbi:sirohydrochlorin chelatase [Dulcicalothrix desertica]|nr:sirohydrochlorin chelatase [Dulcicalothrix desertica]TWH42674.1 sirohydrochlorin ferrochelatase [Dulcicalothrix desertica PCC 7102]